MKKISTKQYIEIKNNAYRASNFLSNYPIKVTLDFINNSIFYEPNTEEYKIFILTLLYPNDVKLSKMYESKENLENFSKLNELPMSITFSKIIEYRNYDFNKLINKGLINKNLANQNINLLQTIDQRARELEVYYKGQYDETAKNEFIKSKILEKIKSTKLF